MLARFKVLLPFVFTIPFDSRLVPLSFRFEEYQATLYPPTQANIEASVVNITSRKPFADAGANLDAARLSTPTETIKINGKETIQANLMQIDFLAAREFERAVGRTFVDPPVESFLNVANQFIEKFRSLGSFSNVKSLTPDTVPAWRIEYLTDDGAELERNEKFSRSAHSIKIRWQANVLTTHSWNKITEDFLGFKPYVWDSLLLDAFAQSGDANAAIVLANAALEAAVDFALEVLARNSKISYQSYEWLTNKRHFIKQPSAKEKFDELLYLVAGRSLKTEEARLWKAFLDLRDARNSMVHEGKAMIKKGKKKCAVDSQISVELLKNAEEIIKWLENLLPEEYRRRKIRNDSELSLTAPARGSADDGKDVYLVGVKSSHPFEMSFADKS